jgi:ATP-dependent Clp protease ATP-binding subunit ClpX
MDNVHLEFDDASLVSIAKEAIKRNTGARGLRAIIEDVMKDIMFDIPSKEEIEKVIIHEDTLNNKQPEYVLADSGKRQPLKIENKTKTKRGSEPA